jgi:hypothetical protein
MRDLRSSELDTPKGSFRSLPPERQTAILATANRSASPIYRAILSIARTTFSESEWVREYGEYYELRTQGNIAEAGRVRLKYLEERCLAQLATLCRQLTANAAKRYRRYNINLRENDENVDWFLYIFDYALQSLRRGSYRTNMSPLNWLRVYANNWGTKFGLNDIGYRERDYPRISGLDPYEAAERGEMSYGDARQLAMVASPESLSADERIELAQSMVRARRFYDKILDRLRLPLANANRQTLLRLAREALEYYLLTGEELPVEVVRDYSGLYGYRNPRTILQGFFDQLMVRVRMAELIMRMRGMAPRPLWDLIRGRLYDQ